MIHSPLAALLLAAFASPAELKVPLSTFNSLESAAHVLAKGGRAEEFRELVAMLSSLGYSKDNAEKLSGACEKELKAAKSKVNELPDAVARMEQAATDLGALLPALKGEEQALVAHSILRLDDEREEAHKALGHVHSADGWQRAEETKLRARRTRILDVLQQAHQYECEITTEPSSLDILVEMHGGPGTVARWNGISIYAPWSADRTTRVLSEVLRAAAVSAFLTDGEQGLPPESWFARPRSSWVLTDSKKEYDRALKKSLEHEWIDKQTFDQSQTLVGFLDRRGNGISYAPSESENEAAVLCWLAPIQDGPMSALKAGHLSYVCQAYLGTPLPGFSWRQDPHDLGETFIKPTPQEQKERDARLAVAKAGLPGAQSWMSWLVRQHADPSFARCVVDFFGKLSGEELLKCTSMVEYWQEKGELRSLINGLSETIDAKAYATYLRLLEETPQSLEANWRDWVVRDEPSLCARVGKQKSPPVGAAGSTEEELRTALNALRAKVLPAALKIAPVELDSSLAPGCLAHAEYLSLNPGQVQHWPDVHNEFPDKQGYSSAGAWAGAHALVGGAGAKAGETLEGWLATYFHRVPLLDPGLLRVGCAANKDYLVFDVYSLRRPPDASWAIVWPHEEMQKVPLTAQDELPSPVPQAATGSLGYPITVQVGLPEAGDPPLEVEMKLYNGKDEVECWFSSPEHPLNPRLVPPRTFALFPKQPLKAGTRYQVTAEWLGTTRKKSWFFRT
ncbi:MAG: hypothetical protein IPJ19_07625 [Planctomycetes bacterium]|nr:hypothetical protein [Planctomycetota bacterium]